MKGAYKGYFSMPNLGRLRSRIVNPDKDLTSKIREKVMQAIAEVVNENAISIKAKVIDFVVTECGLTFKDKRSEEQVASIVGGIFDIYAGSTAETLAALVGEKEETEAEEVEHEAENEEPAGEANPSDEDFD